MRGSIQCSILLIPWGILSPHPPDFDEQCSKEDDWDVDTAVYYDRTAGDRNSIALREMAVERRLKEGKDDDDSWRGREGFERHTKVVCVGSVS